ncbi:MAG: 7-carboxy-7-deazaguanine synthase QueE [Aquificota bacterium]
MKITVEVCEIYKTIQGEGFLIGSPVTLVRFQGCNIYCSWCDTKYAIPKKEDTKRDLYEVLEEIEKLGREHILITGGEPFYHQSLLPFTAALIRRNHFVQIETNGTLWIEGFELLDRKKLYFSVSPKYSVDYKIHPAFQKYCDELKFVVDDNLTLEVLLRDEFLPLVKEKKLILQPEGNKEKYLQKSLKLIDKLLQLGLYARLIPQLHKLVNLP